MLDKAYNYGVDQVAVGKKLRCLRKKRGITQDGMGNFFGISRQAISSWESGKSLPDIDNLIALARFFNVSLDYLLILDPTPVTA